MVEEKTGISYDLINNLRNRGITIVKSAYKKDDSKKFESKLRELDKKDNKFLSRPCVDSIKNHLSFDY